MTGALLLAALALTQPAHAAPAPRIVNASDWNGPTQLFVADPSGRLPVRQLTTGRAAEPCDSAAACGFTDPVPSPDGRRVAYSEVHGYGSAALWLARADGSAPRRLGAAADAVWAPDGRSLAFAAVDGIHVVAAGGGGDRIVDHRSADTLRFARDGSTLAFVSNATLYLLRRGREVREGAARGGLAWAPDGRRLAFVGESGLDVLDTRSGVTATVYRPHLDPVYWRGASGRRRAAPSGAWTTGPARATDRWFASTTTGSALPAIG